MTCSNKINLTYRYRIKDSISRVALCLLAKNVNFVFNYVNELHVKQHKKYTSSEITSSYLNKYSVNNLLAGCSTELNLHSQTIQAIGETYCKAIKVGKFKSSLAWRSSKRSLGWIPFKASAIKFIKTASGLDAIRYNKQEFKIYNSRPLPEDAKITNGSFVQDSRGRWFVSISFEIEKTQFVHPKKIVGVDLGIKDAITLSDGMKIERPNLIKKYEASLAVAQRANKTTRVRSIHTKIKNSRKDYYHKITSELAKQYAGFYVGDVKSQAIVDKDISSGMTKGVYDASWFAIKTFLSYKANKLGGVFKEVSERYTTVGCSGCGAPTGPSGVKELHIREWQCCICDSVHDRDVNAAKNILRIGRYTL